jgi:hypothetical protein
MSDLRGQLLIADFPPTLRDLDSTYKECRRYSVEKKGMLRVSGVLPKWMVGKFLEREYGRIRTRIQHIHDNFEVG